MNISWDEQSKVLYSSFLLYAKIEGYRTILKLSCRPVACVSYKAFSKNKKRFWNSFHASFSAWFLKKNISHVIFYKLTSFHCLITLLLEILGNTCAVIVSFPDCDVINFEINPSLLIKSFFHLTKKVRTKI